MNDIIQDIDKFFISFGSISDTYDVTESDIVYMRILDNNECVLEIIKIPWNTYDDILVHVSDSFLSKEYAIVTIDIPITSTIYKYTVIMMNCEGYMIIRKYNYIKKKLISEYFVIYNNIY